MSVIIVLIAASLLVAVGFLISYLWAVKSGQYDDKYTPSVRILFEDSQKNSERRTQSAELKNEKQKQN
ncbi:MAG: cbb3-type cytochrome oxidase assembly protein CcoS [Ignavibacteriales bacterium]|nr:cbb3-type cytochrome oxidase assembly protein CcoS [Ignavibacteriales bacterium]